MNPDNPQTGRRRSGSSAREGADSAAASDIGSSSLASGFDNALGPAELTDQAVEGRGAQRTSGRFVGSVKEKATSQLNAQKSRATDQLDDFAASVRQSTQRLRAEHHGAVAAMLERGADELERFAATMRGRDVNEFIADIERFGRRQPALFLGTSLAAGLLLARFAKASDRAPGNSNPFSRPGEGFTGQESL